MIKRTSLAVGLVLVLVVFVVLRQLSLKYDVSFLRLVDILLGSARTIKSSEGRTNILLLGVGGKDHEGGDLTDTLMVVSLMPGRHETVLVSIPRDIWIPELHDKINSAYHYGENKKPGGGLTLAKSTVEEVVGLPIHYAVLVDFSGFKMLVDLVDGVDVQVAETFTDPLYPIAGKENDLCNGDPEYKCRYETITFTKGREHMNGERALKYVRSRHADGDAGTDFSRGKRQQAVIVALKERFLRQEVLTDWTLTKSLIAQIQSMFTSDLQLGDGLLLARLFGINGKIRTLTLPEDNQSQKKTGLLINPPTWKYAGKWVLVPKDGDGDFTKIGSYIRCVLDASTSACATF